jgi:hypothetical protein
LMHVSGRAGWLGIANGQAREVPVQVPALQGERILVMEDEGLIALNLQCLLEQVGATCADLQPSLSVALRRSRLAVGRRPGHSGWQGECGASTRGVPFIFYAGLTQHPLSRWRAIPVVQNPAALAVFVGALKFALATGVLAARPYSNESLAKLDKAIFDGEGRVARMSRCIERLEASGFDASDGRGMLDVMTRIIDSVRAQRSIVTSHAWRGWPV